MRTHILPSNYQGAGLGFSGNSLLKTAAFALMVLTGSALAAADSLPPQIQTDTVMEAREPGVIKAMIFDDDSVSKATLFYRKPGEIRFNSIEMKERNDVWYRELKRDLGLDGTVEYYILAQDRSGNESTSPQVSPTERPLRAAMDPMVSQSADEVMLTSPEPGTVLLSGEQMIIVTFYKTDREVDMATVRVRIDDRDRTREAEIKGNMLVWQPRRPLTEGQHLVEIIARDTTGNNVGPNVWTFEIKSKFQLPLGTKGNFFMGLQRDDRSNDKVGEVPLWDNKIDIGLNGEKNGVTWDAGVMLSSEESSFLTSENLSKVQPVNRYYATLRSRHFRMHLGDDNPNFSDLSLKGILVRGVSASFKSDRFNADVIYGYNKRDIGEEVERVQGVASVDATGYVDENGNRVDISSQPYQRIVQDAQGQYHVYEFSPGTFRRNVTALKLDAAALKNRFFSWNLGVNLFSAEDDTTTLDYAYNSSDQTRSYQFGAGRDDVFFNTGYTPKKNWVGTFETAIRFNQNRSVLSAEFGGTMVTDNMFGVVTEDMRDELPDEIDDELFRFNGSTQTSFDKMKLKDDIGSGIGDALTSVYLLRLVTPIPVPRVNTRFKGEVFRIPTHYVSLGNPHQRTDMGGFRFDLKNQILKDQVSLDFGYEAYSDNLDSERKQYAAVDQSVQKNLTKDTQTASVSVGWRPQKFFPEYAPNISVGWRSYTASNNLDTGFNPVSKQIDMFTNTIMLNLGATLPVGVQRHTGTLSFSGMTIGDNRSLPNYDRNESDNRTVILSVNSAVNPLPLTITTTIGRTGNTSYFKVDRDGVSSRAELTTDITILNLAGTYKWLRERRLSTTAGIGYIGSSNGASEAGRKVDNTKTTLRFETDYKLNETTVLGANLRFINYTDQVISSNEYTEPIFGLSVKSSF